MIQDWLGKVVERLFTAAPSSHIQASYDVARLSWILDVPMETLLNLRVSLRWSAPYHYRILQQKKRDGSPRRIYAPSAALKTVQRSLLRHYLDGLPVHAAATGFRRGISVAQNARRHLGQEVVVTADIEDFFGSTSLWRVREFFRQQQWDASATLILTRLCTFHRALPQGAPTSPALSNVLNVSLDEALAQLTRRSRGTYTRYGDDLAFSWPSERAMPRDLEHKVRTVLLTYDYRLNQTKGWQVWRVRRGDVPSITGIRLGRDGQLHPSPEIEQAIARLRRQTNDPEAVAQLRGYEGFLNTL